MIQTIRVCHPLANAAYSRQLDNLMKQIGRLFVEQNNSANN